MMGHACRRPRPHRRLDSVSARRRCLDGSVISAFQDTGDTEEIHLVNVKVSFTDLLNNPGMIKMFGLHNFRSSFAFQNLSEAL